MGRTTTTDGGETRSSTSLGVHQAETRLGGVAHNGFSMAMMLVTTEEYGDQENGEHFFLDIIETSKTHNCGYIFISLLIFSYIFLCFLIFSYVLNCGICVQRMCESNGGICDPPEDLGPGTWPWPGQANNNCPESGGQRGWDLGFPALHRHHSGTGRKDTHNGKRCGNYQWP